MKRILTLLAGVSLIAGVFAASPAPVKAIATGGWMYSPDVIVATRDRFPISRNGTCANPDFTSIAAAVEDLDSDGDYDSHTIGICKGTYIQQVSISLYDEFYFVGEGASKTVIDGSKLEYFDSSNDGIIEDASNGITVANITFKGGAGTFGGAIYTSENEFTDTTSDVACYASSFISNSAVAEGGAIYSEGDIYLNRCTFRNNTAGEAGGAIYGEQDIVDYGSTYTLNTANNGGAVAEGGPFDGPGVVDNTIGFYGSTFTKNSAVSGDGGAIYADHGDTFIEGSKFIGNTASDDGGAVSKEGCAMPGLGGLGGFDVIGGIGYTSLGTCTFEVGNSAFSANTALFGGAIASLDASTGLAISGSTFQLNRAETGAAVASIGFLESGSNQFIRNSADDGVVAYQVNRKATVCSFGGIVGDGFDMDSYWAYVGALIDSAEEIDFSGNRFSRNIGGSSVKLMPFPAPSGLPVTLVIINPVCDFLG
jgi:predicted outer membrane repeat protein